MSSKDIPQRGRSHMGGGPQIAGTYYDGAPALYIAERGTDGQIVNTYLLARGRCCRLL